MENSDEQITKPTLGHKAIWFGVSNYQNIARFSMGALAVAVISDLLGNGDDHIINRLGAYAGSAGVGVLAFTAFSAFTADALFKLGVSLKNPIAKADEFRAKKDIALGYTEAAFFTGGAVSSVVGVGMSVFNMVMPEAVSMTPVYAGMAVSLLGGMVMNRLADSPGSFDSAPKRRSPR